MNEDMRLRCLNFAKRFSSFSKVSCYLFDSDEKCITCCSNSDFCKHCDFSARGTVATHTHGFREASRWNGKYIYYCPAGLAWTCSTIGTNTSEGSIIAGPVILENYSDTFSSLGIITNEMNQASRRLPILTAKELDDLSEVLAAGANGISLINREYQWVDIGYADDDMGVPKTHNRDIVYKTIAYIKQHYWEPISLQDIADFVGLNRSYLSNTFKKETGMPLFSFINKYRVEIAKNRLLNTDMSIVEIAECSGFGDQSYFTRVFRKNTDVTPQQFRSCRGNN